MKLKWYHKIEASIMTILSMIVYGPKDELTKLNTELKQLKNEKNQLETKLKELKAKQ